MRNLNERISISCIYDYASDFPIDRSWSLCYFSLMGQKSDDTIRLEQKIKRLSTLIQCNGIISSSLNPDEFFENVMAISKQIMNADASSIMLIVENANDFIYEVALRPIGEKLKQEFKLQMGLGTAGSVA